MRTAAKDGHGLGLEQWAAPVLKSEAEKAREAKYMGVVVGLMLLSFFLFNMLSSYFDYMKATASESWPKTPVTKADARVWHTAPSRHDISGHWNYYIYYHYTVGGHFYCRLTPMTESADEQSIKSASDEEVNRLMHGGLVSLVSYNPADPDQSTVGHGAGNVGAPLCFMFFYALFLLLPVGLIWWSGKIKAKAETTPQS
jgi:hypothetical protein